MFEKLDINDVRDNGGYGRTYEELVDIYEPHIDKCHREIDQLKERVRELEITNRALMGELELKDESETTDDQQN